jgi:hypothetical protein
MTAVVHFQEIRFPIFYYRVYDITRIPVICNRMHVNKCDFGRTYIYIVKGRWRVGSVSRSSGKCIHMKYICMQFSSIVDNTYII